jgi:hypothetical protein
MNNTLHTPAPWKIATFDGPHEYASIEAGDDISELIRVCDIPNWPCAIEEMQANAHLISAAPDLLSTLEGLLKIAEKQLDQSATHKGLLNCQALANAREALRKAKGEA